MTIMDPANPADAVVAAVERSLTLARTWLAWDGRARISEDGDRIYTPLKAVRRIGDHLVDHLAEVEALLASEPTQPDDWHASLVTLDSDWARFTEADLAEAAAGTETSWKFAALEHTRIDTIMSDRSTPYTDCLITKRGWAPIA